MSWRVVVISQRAKLDLRLNYLMVRGETETVKIYLGEIGLLMVENTAVSLTAALLCEMTKRKIKVIFCDEKRNPSSELVSYYGSHDTSAKLREQLFNWKASAKDEVWTEIVREKIRKQQEFLEELSLPEAEMLKGYAAAIELRDTTNREGHAAKVYFNALFGMDFSRASGDIKNAALDYGYSILLSAFNREIVSNGYITQIGLFHDNMFNQFNFASDLMEPFRPLVDREVKMMDLKSFEKEEKMTLVNILNSEVAIDGKKQYVINAIKIYAKSVFDALGEGDISLIRFYRNEL